MNVKRTLVAIGATGAVAALAFGGTAVATDFTSSQSGSVVANAATFGGTYSTPDLRIDGALPGDSNHITYSYTNSGSTDVDLVLTTDGLSTNGPAGVSLADDVVVTNLAATPESMDAAQNSTVDLGLVKAGSTYSATVTLTLPTTATAADAGGGASIHYTLTATATHA